MTTKGSSVPSTNKNERRRGRPTGRNRVPLSLEERRARNALYERERRNETSEAMAQLAQAACCDPQMAHGELLATVVNNFQSRLKKQSSKDSIEELKRINANLESQIKDLQSRLEGDSNYQDDDSSCSESDDSSSSTSESQPELDSETYSRPTKYRKTKQQPTVHGTQETNSSSASESSTDSQDSVWSHHQLGKTAPNNAQAKSLQSDSSNDSVPQNKRRTITEHSSTSNTDSESNSRCSNTTAEQNEVQMELKLVPGQCQDQPTSSVQDQSEIRFLDHFTDTEKGLLERFGFFDFGTHNDTSITEQINNNWPLDFDDFLASF